MSLRMLKKADECVSCGKNFKRVRTSDPRKGYDVLREDADGWTVQCKGCGEQLVIQKT